MSASERVLSWIFPKASPPAYVVPKYVPPLVTTSLTLLYGILEGIPALFAASLLVSLLGFYRVTWFFSLGYGLSMAFMSCLSLFFFSVIQGASIPLVAMLHASLVIAWGVRLAAFLAWREFKAWPESKSRYVETNRRTGLSKKISTWVFVAIFDSLLFAPCLFHMKTPSKLEVLSWFGVVLQFVGLQVESLADQQKSLSKRERPGQFCQEGLYRFSRHVNYLGEILFWSGSYIASLGSLRNPLQLLTASAGFLAILGVMVGATNNLDRKQFDKYNGSPEYQKYIKETPKLIPFTRCLWCDSLVPSA
ncbi:hypothetical protein GUITHDRAFT_67072 [Guillardia theta CCMP2712]|uniref:Steroid 5-alpha reductase C-terminal domain-containing protein n=1 Tax=Guillardia theta (strain CCMP2712) TaxID=905079 RepID=L1JQA9_GUITC|nr:hypothetical protein GUITHDRAFT_67072 [Guillardia theta CCMP2712]EKX50355.1 hypothetical protein GUITHDRAFT_67072 [Guillardia theta CCMP2712]|eukprot:XP_005837335.1 hypothetical protein GUITHDRAFT_67072 [Guillardia theta CCMP2712]